MPVHFQIRDSRLATHRLLALLVLALLCGTLAQPSAADAAASDRLQQWLAGLPADDDGSARIDVIVEYSGKPGRIAAMAMMAGGQLRHRRGNLHEIRIPAARAGQLLRQLPADSTVRLPLPHAANSVTGTGVAFTGGGDMQALGHDGTGMRIGIIDLGFGNLAAAQASGDLPATGPALSITDYTGNGTGGTDHGTAIAEIVHEMAPGAKLVLARIDSELQLDRAVTDMVKVNLSQRVDVIVHAVSWFGGAFYDGTGTLCSIASDAEINGVLWVASAGNWRDRHYLGTFTDDGGGRHNFATGQNFNTVTLTAGTPVSFTLNWDAYPTTTVDYDLYLYDGNPGTGGSVVASSTNAQSGSIPNYYPYPYEYLAFTPPLSGTYYLVVSKAGGTTAELPLSLFSPQADLGTPVAASSLAQPADCATVLTTGATEVLTDALPAYASEGPTTDGRNKPDIAGPAGVQTSQHTAFGGTSAAAAHVAGAAALLLDRNGALTTAQLRNELIATAEDVGPAGFDTRTGSGRLSLDADGDGLNHDFEAAIGTDPTLTDTDGDNLSDGYEVGYDGSPLYTPGQDLDPTRADTDGDGLNDDIDPDPLTGTLPGDLAPRGAPDGLVNLADYLVAQRLALGLITPTAQELASGDLNTSGASSGVIDTADLLVLLGMILP